MPEDPDFPCGGNRAARGVDATVLIEVCAPVNALGGVSPREYAARN
jgi:hypothetical protein